MRSKYLVLLFTIVPLTAFLQNLDLEWFNTYQELGATRMKKIKIDPSGNIITTGTFFGTTDLDPSAGVDIHTSPQAYSTFLQKKDNNGTVIWSKVILASAQSSQAEINDIGTDQNGNIYVTGQFGGTVDLDPGPIIQEHTSHYYADLFVSKFSASGNLIWLKTIGASVSMVMGRTITVDESDNVIVSGIYNGSVDFDPSNGTSIFTSTGSSTFILKLDDLGNHVWTKELACTNSSYPRSLISDSQDNIYVSGAFYSDIDLDPGVGTDMATALNGGTGFRVKLNSSGDYTWGEAYGRIVSEMHLDQNENLFCGGEFYDTTVFGPGLNGTLISTTYTAFIQAVDASGNNSWVKPINSTFYSELNAISSLSDGSLIISGQFNDSTDFDPDVNNTHIISTVTSIGGDGYTLKLSNQGDFDWVKTFHFPDTGWIADNAVDFDDNIYITGDFQSDADFGGSIGALVAPGVAGYDLKLSQEASIITLEEIHNLSIYPSPASDKINIRYEGKSINGILEIFNSSGQSVMRSIINSESIDISLIPPGVYHIHLLINDTIFNKRLIKI